MDAPHLHSGWPGADGSESQIGGGLLHAVAGLRIAFQRANLISQFPDAFTPYTHFGCTMREPFHGESLRLSDSEAGSQERADTVPALHASPSTVRHVLRPNGPLPTHHKLLHSVRPLRPRIRPPQSVMAAFCAPSRRAAVVTLAVLLGMHCMHSVAPLPPAGTLFRFPLRTPAVADKSDIKPGAACTPRRVRAWKACPPKQRPACRPVHDIVLRGDDCGAAEERKVVLDQFWSPSPHTPISFAAQGHAGPVRDLNLPFPAAFHLTPPSCFSCTSLLVLLRDVLDLFEAFRSHLPHALLFLKNVRSVEVLVLGAGTLGTRDAAPLAEPPTVRAAAVGVAGEVRVPWHH